MISNHFFKKPTVEEPKTEQAEPLVVLAPEPKMTRAEHWAAINAERAAKKAAAQEESAKAPQRATRAEGKPIRKTGIYGISRLK
jgi:hypothetical protein